MQMEPLTQQAKSRATFGRKTSEPEALLFGAMLRHHGAGASAARLLFDGLLVNMEKKLTYEHNCSPAGFNF
jgi:hypothetical protein